LLYTITIIEILICVKSDAIINSELDGKLEDTMSIQHYACPGIIEKTAEYFGQIGKMLEWGRKTGGLRRNERINLKTVAASY